MLWLGLLVGALSVSASVQVEGESGDPQCAWAELVPASLQSLNTLTASSTVAFTVLVDVHAAGLHLELSDGERVLFERDLPADGACEARADGVAFVVEQQLVQLGYVVPLVIPTATATVGAGARPPPAPRIADPIRRGRRQSIIRGGPGLRIKPDDESPPVRAAAPAQVEPVTTWVGVGAQLEWPGVATLNRGGFVEVSVRGAQWGGVLLASVDLPATVSIAGPTGDRGQVTVRALSILAGAEYCLGLGAGRLCGVLAAGVEGAQGTSSGDLLFGEGSAIRAGVLARLGARYRYELASGWAGWLGLAGGLRPSPARFSIEDARTVSEPTWALKATLGGSARIF